jgi:hypothetical protein
MQRREMEMKKAGMRMSVLMGASMSLILSLIGLLSAGQLNLRSLLVNFVISFAISFLIGMVIPMRKISNALIGRMKFQPGSLKARLSDALISDLCYSPLMTFIMVFIAHRQAVSHGARIPFLPMLLKSECISLIAAFIAIYLLSPVLMKIAFRGVQVPEDRRDHR